MLYDAASLQNLVSMSIKPGMLFNGPQSGMLCQVSSLSNFMHLSTKWQRERDTISISVGCNSSCLARLLLLLALAVGGAAEAAAQLAQQA